MGIWLTLSQGYVAIIDREDAALAEFKWSAKVCVRADGSFRIYAVRCKPGNQRVSLHIEILGEPGIDHADGNGLNNRRSNLRLAGQSFNVANQRKRTGTASSFRGVMRGKAGKWVAKLRCGDKRIHIGTFREEINAAQAYNFVADEYFGQFARFNLPTQGAQ